MDVGVEVIFNGEIYEVVHIYDSGFMEIKNKHSSLMRILLVSESEVEKCKK